MLVYVIGNASTALRRAVVAGQERHLLFLEDIYQLVASSTYYLAFQQLFVTPAIARDAP